MSFFKTFTVSISSDKSSRDAPSRSLLKMDGTVALGAIFDELDYRNGGITVMVSEVSITHKEVKMEQLSLGSLSYKMFELVRFP